MVEPVKKVNEAKTTPFVSIRQTEKSTNSPGSPKAKLIESFINLYLLINQNTTQNNL
jgi:hypothetical protein